VICLTTGGAPTMSPEERMAAVRKFKPELASLNTGSMNFGLFPMKERIKRYRFDWEENYLERSRDNVFKNTFYDQERILSIMRDSGTKPEMECYDVGHIYTAAHWAEEKLIEPPFWLQFIFGLMGGIGADIDNLVLMKNIATASSGRITCSPCWRQAATSSPWEQSAPSWAAACGSASRTIFTWERTVWPGAMRKWFPGWCVFSMN